MWTPGSYVPRKLARVLNQALRAFPSVMVTGPRQSGKTTFLREELGSRASFVSLDDPLERGFARTDPNGFLDRFSGRPVVLDEIQHSPELLPYIKLRIDEDRGRRGRWILTGSQQFHLMRDVSESLAGRIAVLELLPFSLLEHQPATKTPLESSIWVGRYPEPALEPAKRDLWLRSYIDTYLQRDVRQLLNVRDLSAFEAFLAVCAARHGQLFNMAEASRECGVSKPTVRSWLGILQASYVVFLLQPYFRNFGKRLVKSPKLYLVDPALACALTRQPAPDAALAGSLGGALFEGLLVTEAMKAMAARGRKPDLAFWRTRDGLEVDLLLQSGKGLWPLEFKLTSTPTARHAHALVRMKRVLGDQAMEGVLVCRVPEPRALPHGGLALPWHHFPSWLDRQLG